MRLLLALSFSLFVSYPKTLHLLVHEDNQAVLSVLNSMVSTSKPIMAGLLLLHKFLVALGLSGFPLDTILREQLRGLFVPDVGSR